MLEELEETEDEEEDEEEEDEDDDEDALLSDDDELEAVEEAGTGVLEEVDDGTGSVVDGGTLDECGWLEDSCDELPGPVELETLVDDADSLVEDRLTPWPSPPPPSGRPGVSVGEAVTDCAFARRSDVERSAREMSVRARAGEAKQQRMVEAGNGGEAYNDGENVGGSGGAAEDNEER